MLMKPAHFDVALIAATNGEYRALRAALKADREGMAGSEEKKVEWPAPLQRYTRSWWKLENESGELLNVLAAQANEMGPDVASLLDSIYHFSRYRPSLCIMSGVCGSEKAELFDLIIPKVIKKSAGKRVLDSETQAVVKQPADPEANPHGAEIAHSEIANVQDPFAAAVQKRLNLEAKPTVHSEVIVTTIEHIDETGTALEYAQAAHRKAVAVEMEGYYFYHWFEDAERSGVFDDPQYRAKCLFVKSVMDKAKGTRHETHKQTACDVAAEFSVLYARRFGTSFEAQPVKKKSVTASGLKPLAPPTLYDRAKQFEELVRFVQDRDVNIVMVTGAWGTGKTALARHLYDELNQSGVEAYHVPAKAKSRTYHRLAYTAYDPEDIGNCFRVALNQLGVASPETLELSTPELIQRLAENMANDAGSTLLFIDGLEPTVTRYEAGRTRKPKEPELLAQRVPEEFSPDGAETGEKKQELPAQQVPQELRLLFYKLTESNKSKKPDERSTIVATSWHPWVEMGVGVVRLEPFDFFQAQHYLTQRLPKGECLQGSDADFGKLLGGEDSKTPVLTLNVLALVAKLSKTFDVHHLRTTQDLVRVSGTPDTEHLSRVLNVLTKLAETHHPATLSILRWFCLFDVHPETDEIAQLWTQSADLLRWKDLPALPSDARAQDARRMLKEWKICQETEKEHHWPRLHDQIVRLLQTEYQKSDEDGWRSAHGVLAEGWLDLTANLEEGTQERAIIAARRIWHLCQSRRWDEAAKEYKVYIDCEKSALDNWPLIGSQAENLAALRNFLSDDWGSLLGSFTDRELARFVAKRAGFSLRTQGSLKESLNAYDLALLLAAEAEDNNTQEKAGINCSMAKVKLLLAKFLAARTSGDKGLLLAGQLAEKIDTDWIDFVKDHQEEWNLFKKESQRWQDGTTDAHVWEDFARRNDIGKKILLRNALVVGALSDLAAVHHHRGDYQKAGELFAKTEKFYPRQPSLDEERMVQRCEYLLDAGRYPEMEACLDRGDRYCGRQEDVEKTGPDGKKERRAKRDLSLQFDFAVNEYLRARLILERGCHENVRKRTFLTPSKIAKGRRDELEVAYRRVDATVKMLENLGRRDWLPKVLAVRAGVGRFLSRAANEKQDGPRARQAWNDLDYGRRIAASSGIILYQPEIHLEIARWHLHHQQWDEAKASAKKAKDIIDEYDYGRFVQKEDEPFPARLWVSEIEAAIAAKGASR
jgi:nucleoside phosphorylase/tetratricopeptide (TPR) repeat protein